MIETSTEIGELAKALVAFQGKVTAVGKGNTAKVEKDGRQIYSYKYADLASVIEATQEAREAAGIAVVQFPAGDGNGITVITTLLHTSGQWMRSTITLRPNDTKPQTIGSLVTYLRRYSYSAALGIATEEDDDGAAAQGNGKPPVAGGAQKANKVPAQPASKGVSPGQVQQIHILKEKIGGWTGKADHPGHPYKAALLAYKDRFGKPVTTSTDLTFDQAANLITRMQGMVDRQAEALKKQEAQAPIAGAMNDNSREPGEDDDDGEAPDPGLLQDVRDAAKTHWGKKVGDLAPQWLQNEFGVSETGELTKQQARRALERLLSGNVL